MSRPIHCIADCLTCGKRWESRNAQGVAARHSQLTGHETIGEIAYGFHYYGLCKPKEENEHEHYNHQKQRQ